MTTKWVPSGEAIFLVLSIRGSAEKAAVTSSKAVAIVGSCFVICTSFISNSHTRMRNQIWLGQILYVVQEGTGNFCPAIQFVLNHAQQQGPPRRDAMPVYFPEVIFHPYGFKAGAFWSLIRP